MKVVHRNAVVEKGLAHAGDVRYCGRGADGLLPGDFLVQTNKAQIDGIRERISRRCDVVGDNLLFREGQFLVGQSELHLFPRVERDAHVLRLKFLSGSAGAGVHIRRLENRGTGDVDYAALLLRIGIVSAMDAPRHAESLVERDERFLCVENRIVVAECITH